MIDHLNVNKFGPFSSEVWGTVSEWVLVTFTVITAILIWRTLRSQLKVQHAQTLLTKIEQNRHRIEVMPKFKLKVYNGELLQINNNVLKVNRTHLTFEINDFNAYSVAFSFPENEHGWKFDGTPSKIIETHFTGTLIHFYISFEEVKRNPYTSYLIFTTQIDFSDQFGNRYYQMLYYSMFQDHTNIINKLPQLLSN